DPTGAASVCWYVADRPRAGHLVSKILSSRTPTAEAASGLGAVAPTGNRPARTYAADGVRTAGGCPLISTVMVMKSNSRQKQHEAEVEPDLHWETAAPPLAVSEPTIERLTEVLKMLADKNRLKVVVALGQYGKMHVTDLCKLLKQSQPAVSHHLTL